MAAAAAAAAATRGGSTATGTGAGAVGGVSQQPFPSALGDVLAKAQAAHAQKGEGKEGSGGAQQQGECGEVKMEEEEL